MSYYENVELEKARQETVVSWIWAFVLVVGAICAMLFGCAWFSTAETISADVYGAKHLEGRITALENCPVLMEHVHPETNKGFTREPVAVRK